MIGILQDDHLVVRLLAGFDLWVGLGADDPEPPAWIPALVDTAGDVLSLDLEPAHDGNVGQLVLFRHNDTRRDVVAVSFGSWLAQLAADLEGGKYEVTVDLDAIRRKR